MTNIFIANLDWEITSEDLHTTFSTFGTVHLAHVVYDNATKRSKGFGYVEMEDVEAAIAAIQALNGMEINDRKIDVKIASPKGNRPLKKEEPEQKAKPAEKKPFTKKPGFQNNNRNYGNNNNNASGEKRPYRPKREDK